MSWRKPARPVRSNAQRQALIQICVAPRDLGVERALQAAQLLEGHGGERQVGADVVGGRGGADDEAFHSLAGGAAEFGRPGGGGRALIPENRCPTPIPISPSRRSPDTTR